MQTSDETAQGNDLPSRLAISDALVAMRLSVDPSELHGSLCGYIAGGSMPDASNWLRQLALDDEAKALTSGDLLDRLRSATQLQLAAQDYDFQLLLPDDDAPLGERADALIAWCNGFLGGFGLAAPQSDALSDEAAEALQDLGRIAASDIAYDDSEADEDALAEIIEFVRVAALLLHGDCALGARPKRQLH